MIRRTIVTAAVTAAICLGGSALKSSFDANTAALLQVNTCSIERLPSETDQIGALLSHMQVAAPHHAAHVAHTVAERD